MNVAFSLGCMIFLNCLFKTRYLMTNPMTFSTYTPKKSLTYRGERCVSQKAKNRTPNINFYDTGQVIGDDGIKLENRLRIKLTVEHAKYAEK